MDAEKFIPVNIQNDKKVMLSYLFLPALLGTKIKIEIKHNRQKPTLIHNPIAAAVAIL